MSPTVLPSPEPPAMSPSPGPPVERLPHAPRPAVASRRPSLSLPPTARPSPMCVFEVQGGGPAGRWARATASMQGSGRSAGGSKGDGCGSGAATRP